MPFLVEMVLTWLFKSRYSQEGSGISLLPLRRLQDPSGGLVIGNRKSKIMKTTFESLLEEVIPEINFLTASGAGIRPGSVLESLEKDIVIGYLPNTLKDNGIMTDKDFTIIEEPYDLTIDEIEGFDSNDAAFKLMDHLGLKYNKDLVYRISFEFEEITSKIYKHNLHKINFEQALYKLKKKNRRMFRRYKGHILVFRVLHANKFKLEIKVERNGKFEADVDVNNVDVGGNMGFGKKENTLLVSNNKEAPFDVIGFKIKGNKLKEID